MSLLQDPLLMRLRREAEEWHLTQTGVVVRNTTQVVDSRDVDVPQVVYTGRLGLKRESTGGNESQQITVEFPVNAGPFLPGDVIHIDNPTEGRVYPLFVAMEQMPDTENIALLKVRCETRVRNPRSAE